MVMLREHAELRIQIHHRCGSKSFECRLYFGQPCYIAQVFLIHGLYFNRMFALYIHEIYPLLEQRCWSKEFSTLKLLNRDVRPCIDAPIRFEQILFITRMYHSFSSVLPSCFVGP